MSGDHRAPAILEQGYVTEDDAAERLGVRKQTLVNMRNLRNGPPHIVWARRAYYSMPDVLEWLKTNPNPSSTSRARRNGARSGRGPGRPRKEAPPT